MTEKTAIKVSVVIPSHNAAHYLADALPHFVGKPAQEVIVVSNGCTDSTVALIKSEFQSVRLIELPVAAVAIARDVGLRAARGEYVAFRDADDEPIPGGIAKQVAFMDENPSCDLLGGGITWVQSGREIKNSAYFEDSDMIQADCLFQCPLHLASSMIRRASFRNFPSTPLYAVGEDWVYIWQAFRQGMVVQSIPDLVNRYIRVPNSAASHLPVKQTLSDFGSLIRAQFLAECGVLLTAPEMETFIKASPYDFGSASNVEMVDMEEARAVFAKILAQNSLVPYEALSNRMSRILKKLANHQCAANDSQSAVEIAN